MHSRILTAGIVLLALIATMVNIPSAQAQLPKLTTSGNRIYQNGQVYMLGGVGLSADAGVNPYANWTDTTPYNAQNYANCLTYLENAANLVTTRSGLYGNNYGWGTRVIRLGMTPDWWDPNRDGSSFNWGYLAAYVDNVVAPFVSYCQSKNIYVILDTGYTAQVSYSMLQPDMPQYNQNHTNGAIWKIWDYILDPQWDTYQKASGSNGYYQHMNLRNSPNVIYELFNEPEDVQVNGSFAGNTQAAWQQYSSLIQYVVNTVRTYTGNLCLIGGLGEATQLQYITTAPVNGGSAGNIGYVAHIYPGGIYQHGNTPSEVANTLSGQYNSCSNLLPVVVTEFNWFADNSHTGPNSYMIGNTDIFGSGLQQWINSNASGFTCWTMGEMLGTGTNNQRYNLSSGALDSNWEDYGNFTYTWLHTMYSNGAQVVFNPNNHYTLTNQTSGMVLDDPGASTTQVALIQYPANGGQNQNWSFLSVGNGAYEIINQASGLALACPSPSTSANMLQATYYNSATWWWTINPQSNGQYSIVNVASGYALDNRGSHNANDPIGQWPYNGSPNLNWSITQQ